MSDDLIIRPALRTDAVRLAELCAQLGYSTTAADLLPRLEELLSDDDGMLFAAEQSGAVIGWVHVLRVCFLESAPFAEIGGLVVDAAARRCGAGSALMAAAEDWARARGINRVRLRSNTIRTEAHAFYQARGYRVAKSQYTFEKEL